MRILIANTGHPATIKGGAEFAALDLARALHTRGHEVSMVVHHGGSSLEESDDGGIRVFSLPNRNLYFAFDGQRRPAPMRLAWHALDSANPWMAGPFGRILDRVRPDLVNSHAVAGLSQLIWRESARRGVPIVHYLHEHGTMCPRGVAFRDGRLCASPCTSCRILTRPRKRLSALVDTVVGVSHFTLRRHLDWGFFPNARQTVLPNLFKDLAFHPRPARERTGPLRIAYFGRLIPDKGAHLIIEAMRRLPAGSVALSIAGTGEAAYIQRLKDMAPEGVSFLGWARAEDVFPALDIAIVPSILPDSQPRATFEAFMYGVPVIGSRSGGIPEQIDEGSTGWLFETGSAEDLARVLRDRIADRTQLDPENFRRRLARLDPGTVIEEYERVFSEAIAGKDAVKSASRTTIGAPAAS